MRTFRDLSLMALFIQKGVFDSNYEASLGNQSQYCIAQKKNNIKNGIPFRLWDSSLKILIPKQFHINSDFWLLKRLISTLKVTFGCLRDWFLVLHNTIYNIKNGLVCYCNCVWNWETVWRGLNLKLIVTFVASWETEFFKKIIKETTSKVDISVFVTVLSVQHNSVL